MNIYFSGIGGVGLGPLAEIAQDAGHLVVGSDQAESLTTHQLEARGVAVSYDQSGTFLQALHADTPIDWFVYTTGLPDNHPELSAARSLGIKVSKRDELLGQIITDKQLKLIAVSGTHGKTTTTGMFVWVLKQLGIPVSYSVGTTLSYGPSGLFDPSSEYFVYECDEFDRNFLHFNPYESLILSVDHDHPDIYPTEVDYRMAFDQFARQSNHVISWQSVVGEDIALPDGSWSLRDEEAIDYQLAGNHNRRNATLVQKACEYLGLGDYDSVKRAIDSFPGTDRRFEKLGDNLYSDYGHHPAEIAATLQMAREMSDHVVLVYQPHQNIRQHEVKKDYTACMALAEHIYWLPTYLSREDPNLAILSPRELIENLSNKSVVNVAELNEDLWQTIQTARAAGQLVLCMGAGTIDGWLRAHLR